MKNIQKLFEKPLPSARSGAFFNAFSYPAKISPESVAVYIAAMTKPGDTIVDTFGGSGSTGIAALLCEHPTERMMDIAKELGVSPEWGIRHAKVYEIGTYGAFASRTLTNRIKAQDFKKAADSFIKKAEEELGNYYTAGDIDGNEGNIRHIIWTELLLCPKCGAEINYFTEGIQKDPVKLKKMITCPNCKTECKVDDMKYITEKYYDTILQKECSRKKRIPAWVYGTTNGINWDRPADASDYERIRVIEAEPYVSMAKKITWGELHRKGYHYGISYLHQFYTKRNYIVMDRLWKMTGTYEERVRDALRLLLLSYNSSHCTMMTRVVAKKASKDFVLTGAQSGVLYISKLPVEKNILLGLRRKAKTICEAYKLLENCTGSFEIYKTSSQQLREMDKSVDLVFTDPPFGDFIPYAEVNQINELWLDEATDRSSEIIISKSQKKSLTEYQKMMTEVFQEIRRVLKENACTVVVFHAAKACIWEAFENVIKDAGLTVKMTNILDKEQATFKQVVSEGAVQGDPLLLLQKAKGAKRDLEDNDQALYAVAQKLLKDSEFNERRAYSLYINECLTKNIKVVYDAKNAYLIMRNLRKEVLNGSQKGGTA